MAVGWDVITTPWGPFFAAMTETGLVRAIIGGAEEDAARAAFLALPDVSGARRDAALLRPVREWIEAYSAGRMLARVFAFDLRGATPFQRAVYAAVEAVPAGQTRTYGQIAAQIGRPRASRAVGAANAHNPLPLLIPCHRLVGRDGQLRGYGTGQGLATKAALLEYEMAHWGLPAEED
ncbi:MAG: methylated-DNA--[protein]-cysteine S-methyltransferase [Anaerolineae bacterium]|nr:methylated-DNA--[protein]-cysteine S-methyltransferase [Anaerolineae bacterium]